MKCGVRSCTEVKSSWLLYRPQCYWRHQSRWQTPAAFIIAVPAWSWAYWVVSLSAQLLSPRFLSRFWPTPRARHHRHETIMAKTTAVTDRHRIRTATPLRPHRRRHATTGIMGRPLAITATATELAASFKQCSNPADGPRPRQPQAHGADATTSMEFAVIFVNATDVTRRWPRLRSEATSAIFTSDALGGKSPYSNIAHAAVEAAAVRHWDQGHNPAVAPCWRPYSHNRRRHTGAPHHWRRAERYLHRSLIRPKDPRLRQWLHPSRHCARPTWRQ